MSRASFRWGILLGIAALCLAAMAGPAVAANYDYDPVLSLTGDCTTSTLDPVADPGCPDPPRPSARFAEPRAVTIDSFGNEYVASYAVNGLQGRIDIFDDEGFFLFEFADSYGPKSLAVDSKGNLYVFEAGKEDSAVALYEPTVYNPAAGEIEYDPADRKVVFTDPSFFEGQVAVDASNDHLYVTRNQYISEFGSAEDENEPLATIDHPKINWTNTLAIDAERRRLYASFCANAIEDCGVLVLDADAPYGLIEEIDGSEVPGGEFRSRKGWLSIGVDEATGHFLIEDLEQSKNIHEFNEDFEYVETLTNAQFKGGNALQIAVSNAEGANNEGYLFIPVLFSPTRVFAYQPSDVDAPEVEGATAANIGETEAELRATVIPNNADTEYVIEYTTADDTTFANAKIAGEGTVSGLSLSKQVIGAATGLTPGADYRFRIVATNEAGPDPDGPEESTFSTYADAPAGGSSCPNSDFRTGASLLLPDCRAYELVTPADTNGRPPKGIGYGSEEAFPTLQASPSGNAVSFMTEGGLLPGTEGTGGFSGDPYRATRSATGWSTVATGPTGTEATITLPGSHSPDQGYAFWTGRGEGTAVGEGGRRASYVSYPDGHSEPLGQGTLGVDPGALGRRITENGDHIIFVTKNTTDFQAQQLEPDAPATGIGAVYDRTSDGVTHVVSLLPGNVTPVKEAGPNPDAEYQAASEDGTGVIFSILGTFYLRVDNSVTYELGKNLKLAGITDDASRAFYVKSGDLFAFDTETEEEVPFTSTGNAVVVNVANDGTRAYFISTTAIAEAGENPNGDLPQPGQQNLYLSEEGQIDFVATVTARDVEGEVNALGARVDGLGLWTEPSTGFPPVFAIQPAKDPSRLTPDGTVMLFQSRADLDGSSSTSSRQIYRYDSVGDRLHCISCNPTKPLVAGGGASLQTFGESQTTPPPFSAFGFVPNLRADGRRAFFESKEALVAADTNGVQDVYEWEEQGIGSCARPGGCIYLISSGRSAHENYLFGVSQSGDDVFFITDDVLVPGDDDTLSVYDARVNGGFPQNTSEDCQGEGCRPNLTPAPSMPGAAKPATGADDQVPGVKPKKCPRGKRKVMRKGKVRCVKKHRKQRPKKNGSRRGAAR